MSLFNDDLDFEDLIDPEMGIIEIVTPTGVEQRIKSLDAAWEALYSVSPNDTYLNREYTAWKSFAEETLDSSLSIWFPSGTLNELDSWKQRYNNAFLKIQKTLGTNVINAPSPGVFEPPSAFPLFKDNTWLYWVGGGLVAGIGLVLLLKK